MKDFDYRKQIVVDTVNLLAAYYFFNSEKAENALLSRFSTDVKERTREKNLWYADQMAMHTVRSNTEYITMYVPSFQEDLMKELMGYEATTYYDCMNKINQCEEIWQELYDKKI